MMPKMIPLFERFERYVVRADDPDDCWGWIGATDQRGYGRIGAGGRGKGVRIASRVSYEKHIGPIPIGLFVCHTCDNPPCTNPRHLFLGNDTDNVADNVADMDAKGRRGIVPAAKGDANPSRLYPERLMRGETQHLSKLTTEKVRAIRAEYAAGGVTLTELSDKFGVHFSNIARVIRRETWAHVD